MAVAQGTRGARAGRGQGVASRGGRGGRGRGGRGQQANLGGAVNAVNAANAQFNAQQMNLVAQMVNNTMATAIQNQIAPLIQKVVTAAIAALPQNQVPPPPVQNPQDDLEAMLVEAQIADAGQRHAIRQSGIASVVDLQLLRKSSDARSNFFKTLSRDHKVNLGLQQQNNLYAVGWWVHALTIRQQVIVPAQFTADALTQALAASSAPHKPLEPTHMIYFEAKSNWFTFFEQFAQLLDGLQGHNDSTTLRYVVCPVRLPGTPARRPFTEADYQLPATGFAFDADNARVATLWTQALSKNASAQLSVDAKLTSSDGRGAAHKLITELKGTSHVHDIRIETAKNDLKKLQYVGAETKFPFADFINQTRQLYRILDDNAAHKVHVEVQVKETFDRMKLKEEDMKSAKMNAFRLYPKDLDKFAETFSNELAIIRPPSSNLHERKPGGGRGLSEADGSNKGKRRGKGKGGKGGKHKKGKKEKVHYDWSQFYPELEGRQITDVFNIPNYQSLSPEAKTWVRKYKENLAKAQVKHKGVTLSELGLADALLILTSNSRRWSSGSSRRSKGISKIKVLNRRHVESIQVESLHSVKNESIPGTEARNELDTHAHGAALAANWHVIELTGELVDVNGFSESLNTMKDIPIVKAASIYVCRKTGREYLLIIDQAMYFGTLMDHSLINPNQIRQFGHSLCDDPYDPHRELQLDVDGNGLSIPFEMDGPDIYFDTRAPTDEEIVELVEDQVVLTGPTWNPSEKNLLSELRPTERSDRALEALRTVQDVNLGCTCVTDKDKTFPRELEGKFDGALARQLSQVSTAFDEEAAIELLTQSVNYTEADIQPKEPDLEVAEIDFDSFKEYKHMAIAQVRAQVNREKRSLSTIRLTSRHSSITTEHLAKTFMISLPKAQQLQRITTQKGIRRGVGPMERRLRDLGPSLNKPKLGGHW